MTTEHIASKQDVLAAVEPFSRCTRLQIAQLAQLAREELIPPGGVLTSQHDPDLTVYVIASGEVDVVVDGARVATLGAGEIVGERAMLGDGRRSATVTAATAVRAIVLDPRDVDDALAAVPTAARQRPDHA